MKAKSLSTLSAELKEYIKKELSEEKYLHSIGSEETAKELAEYFNADVEKACFAALIHDIAKSKSNEELLKLIRENNIKVSASELAAFKTLHAPVGAFIAKKDFDINDKEVLDAIRWHTIGHKNMSDIEKIVFLADKTEVNTRDLNFRNQVLKAIYDTNNLDYGLIICYKATIQSLLERKLYISIDTINVWNYLTECLLK